MAAMAVDAVAVGATVRVVEPPEGDSWAKFRDRIGVVERAVPGEDALWVVAVKRQASERATTHVLRSPENAFEFLPCAAAALELVSTAAPAPDYSPEGRRKEALTGDDADAAAAPAARVAVIVPFRDLHAEQKRADHLRKFVPHIVDFLGRHCADYRVVIAEQSADGRKFNRGQLLNAGAILAAREGCDCLVFHDVDLLPSDELGPWYATAPARDAPVHVARVWDRYSGNEDYFGGVAAWRADDFSRINGFPNNYWGWGGEDDEMMRRSQTVFGEGFSMAAPTAGAFEDLEGLGLMEKVQLLREHKNWKCNHRWELGSARNNHLEGTVKFDFHTHRLRDEHLETWTTNGLRRQNGELPVTVTATEELGDRATKYTVDLALAGDWTDAKCGLDVED